MKIDYIIKEELWRSIAVYGGSFLIIGFLSVAGNLPVPLSYMLLLALIPTAVHFLVMVRYRRKENLTDPTITNIFRHALRLRDHGEKTTTRRRAIFEKVVDTVLAVVIFLIYLYASLAYSISQNWLPVLLIIGLLLTRIVFIDGGERRITLVRSVVFYLIVAAIVVLRYLALGYPVVPLLQAIVLVGIVAFPILYIWERRSAQEGKD